MQTTDVPQEALAPWLHHNPWRRMRRRRQAGALTLLSLVAMGLQSVAAQGPAAISLGWEYNVSNEEHIDFFVVYRKAPGAGYEELAITPKEARTFTDHTASWGTPYCYVATARGQLGSTVAESEPSNKVCLDDPLHAPWNFRIAP